MSAPRGPMPLLPPSDVPECVQVGPYCYRVVIEPRPFPADDNSMILQGQCAHLDGLIRIVEATPEQMDVTFWHEVLHAIDNTASTGLTEEQVDRMGTILALTLRQNGYTRTHS